MPEKLNPEERESTSPLTPLSEVLKNMYEQPIDESGHPTEAIATPSENEAMKTRNDYLDELRKDNPNLEIVESGLLIVPERFRGGW